MRRHGNNEEGKGAAQKGFETRGCRYFMWSMMTKLKHVQTILQMRRHGNNEEGKGAAQKGFETRGCRYFMWSMMTKLKHVQQSAADVTIPTE